MKKKISYIKKIISNLLILSLFCTSIIIVPVSKAAEEMPEINSIIKGQTMGPIMPLIDTSETTRIIVKYKNQNQADITKNDIKALTQTKTLNTERQISQAQVEVLSVAKGENIQKIMGEMEKNNNIEYIQPDYPLAIFNQNNETDLFLVNDVDNVNTIEQSAAESEQADLLDEPVLDLDLPIVDPMEPIKTTDTSKQTPSNVDELYLPLQWGLQNLGQEIQGQVGIPGIDINITPLWANRPTIITGDDKREVNQDVYAVIEQEVSTVITDKDKRKVIENVYAISNSEIVVAVLDTGMDTTHPDLQDAIIPGWDFANNDDSVFDYNDPAHATQIAGIIAAQHNQIGIAGIAPKVKIMPLKFIQDGIGYTSDAIAAIEYAKSKGVKIINCSWGSAYYNRALKDVMGENSDILFICAAGNNGGETNIYPAAFNLLNTVSIASVDNQGNLAFNSNYGRKVATSAPGVNIYTTSLNQGYDYQSGTSMAAAFASGAAAWYQSINSDKSAIYTSMAIRIGATRLDSLADKVQSNGILNAVEMVTVTAEQIDEAIARISNIQEEESSPEQNGDAGGNGIIPINEYTDIDNINTILSGSTASNRTDQLFGNCYKISQDQEEINANTGSLKYFETDLVLPGRNGLDLELIAQYDSNEARMYERYGASSSGYYTNGVDEINKNLLAELGTGWSYRFSYISYYSREDSHYLHLADGTTFCIQKNTTNNTLNLLSNYNTSYGLQDITIAYDSGFSNGIDAAVYSVSYADGKKEYFATNGNLIGIKDRYNNTISFKYNSSGNSNKVEITDTLGRLTTIERISTDTGGQIDVIAPDGSKVQYNLYNTFSDSTKHKLIYSRIDQNNNYKTYGYEYAPMFFNFFSTSIPNLINSGGWIGYMLLRAVNQPTGAYTLYTYQKQYGKLGTSGIYEYNAIQWREDWQDGLTYNSENYQFGASFLPNTNNFTGYVDELNWVPGHTIGFTYYTYVFKQGRYHQRIKFNYRDQKEEDIISVGTSFDTTKIKQTNYEYAYRNLPPTKITEKSFRYNTSTTNPDPNNFMQTITCYDYDGFNKMTAYWNSQAEGNTSNTEYKTTFTYHPTYHYLLTKQYKKDSATTIKEENTPTFDGKAIATAKILANNVLKKQDTYTYDSYGNVTQNQAYITASTALTTTYTYDRGAYVASKATGGLTENYTYDSMGHLKTSKNPKGYTTSYDYDSRGRITKITHPDINYQGITYNDTSNIVSVRNERGYTYTHYYSKLGDLIQINSPTGVAIAKYEYDSLRRMTKAIDGLSHYTTYQYDIYDQVKQKESRNSAGTLLAAETHEYIQAIDSTGSRMLTTVAGDTNSPDIKTAEYINKHGFTTKQSRFEGATERFDTFTNDYLGNKNQVLTANDAALGRAFSQKFTYDYAGRLTKQTFKDNNSININYDLLGRKTSQSDPKGSNTLYTYDTAGRLSQEQIPFEGSYSTLKKYAYDNNNNIVKLEISNNKPGQSATYQRTDYTYNNRDRLTKVSAYNGATLENYVDYQYDAVGNKTKMITGNGLNTTTYTYDTLNRLTKYTDPLGKNESYVYDNNDNITKITDRNNNVITNTYDGLNRFTNITVSKGPKTKTFTYTKTGNLLTQKDENLTLTHTYDNLGRLTKTVESNGIEKTYTYNLADQQLSFILKQNNVQKINQNYTYDLMDRLQTVKDGASQIAGYTYDANGNRLTQSLANGVTTNYAYNLANQITSMSNKKGTAILSSYTYSYYLDGSPASKTDHAGKITNYTYDGLGRLTKEAETGGLNKTYTYDKSNNRTGQTVTGAANYTVSYTYDKNNRLTAENTTKLGMITTSLYYYDGNGNQTNKVNTTRALNQAAPFGNGVQALGMFVLGTGNNTAFTDVCEIRGYDGFNRLTKTKLNGNTGGITAEYTYRPDDLRLSKTVNGVKTTHIWDGNNIVLDLNNSNAVQNRYLRGNSLIAIENNGVKSYYLHDGHGDVIQLANASGAVTKNYAFDAFGNETAPVGTDLNPFRYGGEYYDSETESYYIQARYYSPANGRWLSEDTHWNQGNMIYGDNQEAVEYAIINGAKVLYGERNNVINYEVNGIFETNDVKLNAHSFDINNQNDNALNIGQLHSALFEIARYNGNSESPIIVRKIVRNPDIEAIKQSSNLYVYVMNNPVKYYDPTGNVAFLIAIPAAGSGIAAAAEAVAAVAAIVTTAYAGSQVYEAAKSKASGKEKASDIPSWAKGQKPKAGESGKDFAKRLLDNKYGEGKYKTGPGSEYNKLQKYGDRGGK